MNDYIQKHSNMVVAIIGIIALILFLVELHFIYGVV